MTYLCSSPVAEPMDRHSKITAARRPTDSRNLGLRAVWTRWRDGGSFAWAAFHEYPLPASMVSGDLAGGSLSTSSPLAWDSRIEELRALTESLLLVSLCE